MSSWRCSSPITPTAPSTRSFMRRRHLRPLVTAVRVGRGRPAIQTAPVAVHLLARLGGLSAPRGAYRVSERNYFFPVSPLGWSPTPRRARASMAAPRFPAVPPGWRASPLSLWPRRGFACSFRTRASPCSPSARVVRATGTPPTSMCPTLCPILCTTLLVGVTSACLAASLLIGTAQLVYLVADGTWPWVPAASTSPAGLTIGMTIYGDGDHDSARLAPRT